MQKHIIQLILLTCLVSFDSYSQDWTQIAKTDSVYKITDILMLDIETGVLLNDESSLWYTNGGANDWAKSATSQTSLNALGKIGDGGFWIAGDGGLFTLGTINLGSAPSLSNANTMTTANLNNAYVNSDLVWIVGSSGTLLFSEDQGNMFRPISTPGANFEYTDIAVGRARGVIVGNNNRVVISKNGGRNWELGSAILSTNRHLQVELINDIFYVLSDNGVMHRSADGEVWATFALPASDIKKFSYAQGAFVLAGDSGQTYRGSLTGGWTVLNGIPSQIDLQGLYCNEYGCFTGGDLGRVYFDCTHIEIGGIVWGDYQANCIYDIVSESGYRGVSVTAVDTFGNTVASALTDQFGRYQLFVPEGSYQIVLPASNFGDNAILRNTFPCDTVRDADNNVAGDQNGVLNPISGDVTTLKTINVGCGTEFGSLGVVNRTVDFGLTFDCSRNQTDKGVSQCSQAQRNCDITSLESECRLMNSPLSNQDSPGCTNTDSPSNTEWFRVVGGLGTYSIDISIEACFPGFVGSAGYKVGVKEVCSGDNIFCQDRCNGLIKTVSIPSSIFQPGKEYLVWLDGCQGSICGYSWSVSGNYQEFDFPNPTAIKCNDDGCDVLCIDDALTVSIEHPSNIYQNLAATYTWNIRRNGVNIVTQQTSDNEFTYNFSSAGLYEVCINNVMNQCANETFNYCESIEVADFADEDFGVVDLCYLDIINYTGPMTYNDDPNGVADPNGDGNEGWVTPFNGFFMAGNNQQEVISPEGCAYTQQVFINELPNSDVAIIDTTLCGDDVFPIVILNEVWFADQINRMVTLSGQAANGCDSLNSLSIYVINIEGDINTDGCDDDGVKLVFTPTTLINTGSFPLDIVWRGPNNNVIPDDGDGNPYTTTVPLGNADYTLTITGQGSDGVTCPFIFDTSISFEEPTITLPNEACEDEPVTINLQLPSGINPSAALWNVDGATFDNPIFANQLNTVTWDTPGIKTVILAYINDGCYVESQQQLEVYNRLDASEVACISDEGSVTFAWSSSTVQQVQNIDIITGQNGAQLGNTFIVDDLLTGELVTIIMDVTSTICEAYTLSVSCSSAACDSALTIVSYEDCASASLPLCDLTTWRGQCASLNISAGTTNPNVPCGQGPEYNYHWIPFVAGIGTYNIDVTPSNCENLGAVQYAIFSSCNVSDPIICSSDCTDQLFSISSEDLVPGNTYLLWLNACSGLVCDYSLDIKGNYLPYSAPTNPQISANGIFDDTIQNCSVTAEINIFDPGSILPDALRSYWSITDQASNVTQNSEYSGPIGLTLSPGLYNVCLDSISHQCSGTITTSECVVIQQGVSYPPIVINCESSLSEVVFTWNGHPGHISYEINVTTGQTGVLDTNIQTFTVSNLTIGEEVSISLVANVENGCGPLLTSQSCVATDCPSSDINIGYNGPTEFCIADTAALIDLDIDTSMWPNATFQYSGPGLIDNTNGIFAPAVSGVGNHHAVITIITNDGACVYKDSIEYSVIPTVFASFAVDQVQICQGDTVTVTFNGTAPSSSVLSWNFDGAMILSGSGFGPFTLLCTQAKTYTFTLKVTDDVCPASDATNTVIVNDCDMSCVCPAIIDTTITCPQIYDPVCGCDGVTYANACQAHFYGGIPSWRPGPCNAAAQDTVRAICDDGDPNTDMDVVQDDCTCKGEIIMNTVDIDYFLRLYPNPTSGSLLIEASNEGTAKFIDNQGQIWKKVDIQQGTSFIDISLIPAGIYTVRWQSGNQYRHSKIIKI